MREEERDERDREMEAREMRDREPVAEQRAGGNGMNEYWTRFEAIQAQFIDEPQSAVRSAQKLVEEAVDRMMEGLRHTGAGDKADTEELRVAMKRYRDVLQQITGEGSSGTYSEGRENYSSTPTPSASRRDLPTSGEETPYTFSVTRYSRYFPSSRRVCASRAGSTLSISPTIG